eukprot:TRINITY_DN4417_c0_g1_i1.p1 TRINITY_DN4417_c0_g1~~TRINITY_DN4417_c0_g1_i1.p1  ORF type:complete len:246 (-),score=42.73 TRINITY_DN4417_c0_g1_i1:117-854(-)
MGSSVGGSLAGVAGGVASESAAMGEGDLGGVLEVALVHSHGGIHPSAPFEPLTGHLLNQPLIVAALAFGIAHGLRLLANFLMAEREVQGRQVERRKVERVEGGNILPGPGPAAGYKERLSRNGEWRRMISVCAPSAHAACTAGLTTSVALREGPGSHLLAACLVLASIVMYDSSGVHQQAGRQAEVLNQIVYELPPEHPLADTRPLREPLGHTPLQVGTGALLGILVACLMLLLFPAGHSLPAQR